MICGVWANTEEPLVLLVADCEVKAFCFSPWPANAHANRRAWPVGLRVLSPLVKAQEAQPRPWTKRSSHQHSAISNPDIDRVQSGGGKQRQEKSFTSTRDHGRHPHP